MSPPVDQLIAQAQLGAALAEGPCSCTTDKTCGYCGSGTPHGYKHSPYCIEGFWSLVKRGIGGVNHAVSAKYLQGYLNAYAFRYNRRDQEQPMFEAFLAQIVKQGG